MPAAPAPVPPGAPPEQIPQQQHVPQQPPQQQAAPPPAGGQQPGYGYPGQQPGYGYPQQPGPYQQQPGPYNSPQQQGGYGQPGPNPYAQQPPVPNPYASYAAPAPQQQYPGGPGMPGAPGMPPPPLPGMGAGGRAGAPGVRGFLTGKPGIVLAAVVAAVVVVGGGSWLAFGSGGDKKPVAHASPDDRTGGPTTHDTPFQGDGKGPGGSYKSANPNSGRKAGEAKVLWQQAPASDVPESHNRVYGPWFVGNTVVRALYKQVAAYSAATGKQVWSLTLPQAVCAAPVAPTADGTIVVGYEDGSGESANCDRIKQIDLKTGKAGWDTSIGKADTFDVMLDLNMAIVGDTVAVSRVGGTNTFRVSDGKPLFTKLPGDCQPSGMASGPKMIAYEVCSGTDSDAAGAHQLQQLDPVTGKAKWTFKLAAGLTLDKVYSVDPLVVSFQNEDEKTWSIASFNANGTERATMKGGGEKFTEDCGDGLGIADGNLQDCNGIVADAHTLYMETALDRSKAAGTNAVVAFDLATGKLKWKAPAPSDHLVHPVAAQGGGVLVYEDPGVESGGALAALGPAGGAFKVVQKHPDGAADAESSAFFHPSYRYVGGRFFLTGYSVDPGSDEQSGVASLAMMALGGWPPAPP
ncbi:outer membrane protein assembly factor BamB family protein, partial [Streptomyces sp. 8L]|uniref:outer membrane protein assembly factor BamB family protein n=1 Tax=Streptomyces sp. 8L TaxID=2877242 RepID=UPI001CD1CE2D